MEPAIVVTDVSMRFNMAKEKVDNLKEFLIKKTKGSLRFEEFYALKNVSLTVEKGSVCGVVGLNGSGKSTLMKIIAGVMKPTQGTVKTYGAIAPLIELGAGFDMDLTARENIFLNGAVLGFDKKFIREKFDEIIEFSEMREFLDVPMKNYSTGMVTRVAFAIATVTDPDILIADEILSVGDFLFQEKCERRIEEMIGNGTTVLLVNHNVEQVERLCDHAIWLNKGEVIMDGSPDEVCDAYKNLGKISLQ